MPFSFFSRKDSYSQVIDVTPEMAGAWLSECNTHNRRLVESHVNYLARQMKSGEWRLTHQGIAFSPNRVLLDGQHRLWAIVISETTVPMRVFFNEPADTLMAIDAVRPRTNDEVITLVGGMGTVSRNELSTLRAMLAGFSSYTRRAPSEEAAVLRTHRRAIHFSHEILSLTRFRGVVNSVTRAVLARAYYSADHASLQHFADVLQSGVATGEQDQPIMMLFKFLIDSAQVRRGRPEVRERYGKTERALAAYLADEQLGRLYSAAGELFLLPGESHRQTAA